MKPGKAAIVICAAFHCTILWAEPAAWYRWRSPYDDIVICSQISPGDSWVVMNGPYKDASCKKLGVPH